ncbi:hypothetical protein [Bacillus rubiinfantis]|uniref:hypothetical protein n=1 Tax=Bacillus rubiinfantis TaxID=1499680 RepID=UPI0005A6CC23|nr:hypothetical protein [Bacillus rubiinfantis]
MKKPEMERALLAQHHQLQQVNSRLSELSTIATDIKANDASVSAELDGLDEELAAMFKDLGLERVDSYQSESKADFSAWEGAEQLPSTAIDSIYKKYHHLRPLPLLETASDQVYITAVHEYLREQKLDTTKDPLLQILGVEQAKTVLQQYDEKFGKLPWTEWDYGVVALSALLAILVDFFVVRIPRDMTFKGHEYKGSPVTNFLNKQSDMIMGRTPSSSKGRSGGRPNQFDETKDNGFYQWLREIQKKLEEYAKVPYDISHNDKGKGIDIDGLRPSLHRLMSPGHDPILGFVFGVIDILRGTMTTIDQNGVLRVLKTGEGSANVFEAVLQVFAHTLSDIPTPSGIQPPFFTLLQSIQAKSPFTLKENGVQVTYTHLARFMYSNGYDLRHFATMSLVPATVEIVVRLYYNIANFDTLFAGKMSTAHKGKLSSMLTLAHSMTMGGNVVKMWSYGWNPLAFNWAELLALSGSFITFLKNQQKRQREIDTYLLENWESLYKQTE